MTRTIFYKCPIDKYNMEDSIALIKKSIDQNQYIQHSAINVAKLINIQHDKKLRYSVVSSDLISIDGQGIVIGAWLKGVRNLTKVSGIDLFINLLKMSELNNFPVYFVGAKQDVLLKTVSEIKKKHPQLEIAGFNNRYFKNREQEVVNDIAKSGAKLLFVAMSSPLKENFISKWGRSTNVNFVMGVGGSFDIIAGKTKRAPMWMQKNGLEWCYRIYQEPRRMLKRYLVTNLRFLFLLLTKY